MKAYMKKNIKISFNFIKIVLNKYLQKKLIKINIYIAQNNNYPI
jgi:hypothetical protein